jgi:choline transporter-like protein 2/4/5
VDESKYRKNWLLAFTIIFGIVTMTFACSIYCCWGSLKKAIDVIDASSDFVAKTKRIILVPLFFTLLTLIAVVLWFASFTAVISMNDISAHSTIPQGKDLDWKPEVKWMAAYMFFGILWVTAWLEYSSQFVIMVSASSYYFNSNSETDGSADVCLGFKYAILHTGSIAIGAFIIAIVQFIRTCFMWLAKKAE